MFNGQQPHRAQNTTGGRAASEIPDVDLEPTHPRCLVCRLHDVADRLATEQWLASAQQNRHELFGTLFCSQHAWRAWEVAHLAAQPSTDDASERHRGLAELLARTIGMLAAQVTEVSTHVGDTGWRASLTALLGKQRRAPLWERPHCPLCAAVQQGQSDEDAVLHTFNAHYAQLSPSDRQLVAMGLCPRDRRQCQPFIHDVATLLPKPRYALMGQMPQWWLVEPEIAKADAAFVRRLLEGDPRIPAKECPACFARVEHEHALLAELRRKCERGEGMLEVGVLVENLCSRHTALLQSGAITEETPTGGTEAREDGGTQTAPLRWPAGTLRPVSREGDCLICTTLWGWNLLRMEGLRRAAGGIFLDVGSAAQLAASLEAHHSLFCLPHWRQITAAALREITPTLLPIQQQGLLKLLAASQAHLQALDGQSQEAVAHSEIASDPRDPCLAALGALAGHPC
jgi:hypothetical protein